MKVIIVGITGLMGSGKSYMSQLFKEKGAILYNTDKEAKILQMSDIGLMHKLTSLYGKDYYKNGFLNHDYIKSLIFENENGDKNLKVLTKLIGDYVKDDFFDFCLRNKDKEYILIESAILFESGLNEICDLTINVQSKDPYAAAKKRGNTSKENWDFLMSNQIPESEKDFDFYIVNDYTNDVNKQVNLIHNCILQYSEHYA